MINHKLLFLTMDMFDTALTELRRGRCDPNEEDCSHVIDEEFKDYAVNNLGWSALFKITVPDLLAGLMFWYHYRNNNVTDFKVVKNKMTVSEELMSLFEIEGLEGDQMPVEK